MKRVHWGNMLFGGLLFAFVLLIVLTSLSYSPKARLIPLIIGGATLVMVILVLINEVYPKLLRSFDVSLVSFVARGTGEERDAEKTSKVGKRLLNISIWSVSFLALIYLVGFVISIGVFILAFLKAYGKVGWVKAIAETVIIWGFCYGVFEIFLKVDLFEGILFGVIVPPI